MPFPPYVKPASLLVVLHNHSCILSDHFESYQCPLSKNLFKEFWQKTPLRQRMTVNLVRCSFSLSLTCIFIMHWYHFWYHTVSLKQVLEVNVDKQTFNYSLKPQANQQFMCSETSTFTDTDPFCAFVSEDELQKTMGPCVFLCWLSHQPDVTVNRWSEML